MRIGTSHFVSRRRAIHYYHAYAVTYVAACIAVDRKLREGEIHLGKPPLKPGERLVLIDDGDRYAIEDSA